MEPNPYDAPRHEQRIATAKSKWIVVALLGVGAAVVSFFAGCVAYGFVAGAVFARERAALGEAHNSADSWHVEAGLIAALSTLVLAGVFSVAGIWAYARRP